MTRLLVLPCSATKSDAPGVIPAIHRYQGPLFSTLRARLAELPKAAWAIERGELAIKILSARFGFIDHRTCIQDYDQRMTQERADEILSPWQLQHDWNLLKSGLMGFRSDVRRAEEIAVVAGADYRRVISEAIVRARPTATLPTLYASGGIGDLRAALGTWLRATYA